MFVHCKPLSASFTLTPTTPKQTTKMATILNLTATLNPCPNPNPNPNLNPTFSTTHPPHLHFQSQIPSDTRKKPNNLTIKPTTQNRLITSVSSRFYLDPIDPLSSLLSEQFDIVIVGAGIIGLTIARHFLRESNMSVAIIDSSVPCTERATGAATGAGQGYIWMAGKTPGSDTWDLGLRGKKLWEELAQGIQNQGMSPLQELGWKKTGSLLIGRTVEELAMLKDRVKLFLELGVKAEFLSREELALKEPLVDVGEVGGAAFLPDDCQIDALRAVAYIQKENRGFGERYAEFFDDPVIDVVRSGNGEIEGVRTMTRKVDCKEAVVVAAGSWSGGLMKEIGDKFDLVLDVPVRPRKGHLLVIENFDLVKLNHGLMEVGYMDHQVAAPSESGVVDYTHTMSISMTATLDAAGNLVLGSSRQFAGFDTEADETIIDGIWKSASEFLPVLKEVSLEDISKNRKVRVGLRPYMPDGKPIICPVPGLPKVVLAAGHEGVGLTLALGTAEMVFDMVKGNKSDYSSFSFNR